MGCLLVSLSSLSIKFEITLKSEKIKKKNKQEFKNHKNKRKKGEEERHWSRLNVGWTW